MKLEIFVEKKSVEEEKPLNLKLVPSEYGNGKIDLIGVDVFGVKLNCGIILLINPDGTFYRFENCSIVGLQKDKSIRIIDNTDH